MPGTAEHTAPQAQVSTHQAVGTPPDSSVGASTENQGAGTEACLTLVTRVWLEVKGPRVWGT